MCTVFDFKLQKFTEISNRTGHVKNHELPLKLLLIYVYEIITLHLPTIVYCSDFSLSFEHRTTCKLFLITVTTGLIETLLMGIFFRYAVLAN